MNDPGVSRMKPRLRAAALVLSLTVLAGCGGGSPYRVETRDPSAGQTSQQTYEQLIRERRLRERSQGAQSDI